MIEIIPCRSRLIMRLILPALLSLGFVAAIVQPGSASAVTKTNVLTVSGGLKGTLTIVPKLNCGGLSVNGGSLSWTSATLSPRKRADWSLNMLVPHYGTFTKFGMGQKATVTLTTINLLGWVATKGTLTFKAQTGSVNLTLGAFEGGAKGKTYIKGSWNCG